MLLVATLSGCGEDPPLPTAPTAVVAVARDGTDSSAATMFRTAGDAGAVSPTTPRTAGDARAVSPTTPSACVNHDSDGLGDDDALKSHASVPIQPVNGVEVTNALPVLTAANARGLFVDATFNDEYVLYTVDGGICTEVEIGQGMPVDNNSSSYQVVNELDLQANYVWRVRPFLDGAYGPWSQDASFRTAITRLGAPRLLAPIDGATVGTRPVFEVRNGTVEGRMVDVIMEIQVSSDDAFSGSLVTARKETGSRTTEFRLPAALTPGALYYWRARATATVGSGGGPTSPWSGTASFRTATVRLGPPVPVSPVDGAEVSTVPVFSVRNGTIDGDAGTVSLTIEVGLDANFANVVEARTEPVEAGTHSYLQLRDPLMSGTSYYWRAAASTTVDGKSIRSAWSVTAMFRTGSSSSVWPPRPPGGHPPNMIHVVRRVAAEHPEKLEAAWDPVNQRWNESNKEFLDLVIDALREVDARWAYNCVRGDCNRISIDVAAYYRGAGTARDAQRSTDVALIDFLAGTPGGGTPQAAWTDITEETRRHNTIGRWIYPRPGR